MSGDWDPRDPESPTTRFDLSDWTVDDRAEVIAALAEAEIAHSWDGDELLVSQDNEDAAEQILDEIEATFDDDDDPDDESDDDNVTEYELDDWTEGERSKLSEMLDTLDIGYRWEGPILVVPIGVEDVVDSCLDSIDGRGTEVVDD
jgi:hypothetical protein